MKKLFLLGSTGSIGKNTLNVVSQHPTIFNISVLAANKKIDLLAEQIKKFNPKYAVIYNKNAFAEFLKKYNFSNTKIVFGENGLSQAMTEVPSDIFLNAFVGFAGLAPTVQAIKLKMDIAIANKETLVVAGQYIKKLVAENEIKLLPIDSEHSAIWQCLRGEENNSIKRIILTASGGPFRNMQKDQLHHVTPKQALKHPNWNMGSKITIDSATLMNKGLEVIEAHWLYDIPAEKIEVVIHPQSIIHSMVEFEDNSIKAQLGIPDMRIPILYALIYPQRLKLDVPQMDFKIQNNLTFDQPDFDKFPCLKLAYEALKAGKTFPTVLNAANEIAVDAFLNSKIKFTEISLIIEEVLDLHQPSEPKNLNDFMHADRIARNEALRVAHLKQIS